MEFTTNRPKVNGFYYVIWEEGDAPMLVWINYFPKGTLLKDEEDDRDYWTWGLSENDDPESLEADVLEPEKIMFSELMSELKTEHLVYMSDEMYTPIHYKGIIVKQPFFEGKGNHSVAQLEAICEQFKEYCHQQAIIKKNCMKHIVELKFGVEFPQNEV